MMNFFISCKLYVLFRLISMKMKIIIFLTIACLAEKTSHGGVFTAQNFQDPLAMDSLQVRHYCWVFIFDYQSKDPEAFNQCVKKYGVKPCMQESCLSPVTF